MVMLSFWNPDRILADPFCGSGTIPIEAAMIGMNIAPGMRREFAAQEWPLLKRRVWEEALEEARDSVRHDIPLRIRGTDVDKEVLSLARYHAFRAGLKGRIHWQQMPVSDLSSQDKFGIIICNPPYGQRLEDAAAVEKLYREMGQVFQKLDTWSIYVLTAHRGFEKLFDRRADRRRKLYNGRIECQYYQFYGPRPPRRVEATR